MLYSQDTTFIIILVAVFIISINIGMVSAHPDPISGEITKLNDTVQRQVIPEDRNKSTHSMESALIGLINPSNREEYAERSGINYRNGRVQVVIEMKENTTVPKTYNTTNEIRYTGQGKHLIQAYISVDELVPLSNEARVEYVRLPMRGSPSQEPQRIGQDANSDTDADRENKSEGYSVNESQESQQNEDRGTEDLSSVMGSIVVTLLIILTAAYWKRT